MVNVSALPSVTLAPDDHIQNDELLVSSDRNFAVHGEIMMLVEVCNIKQAARTTISYECICGKFSHSV